DQLALRLYLRIRVGLQRTDKVRVEDVGLPLQGQAPRRSVRLRFRRWHIPVIERLSELATRCTSIGPGANRRVRAARCSQENGACDQQTEHRFLAFDRPAL